jgi:phenylalanyl-tRNA synthetase beta chain
MKISLNWLRELVELPAGTDADAIAKALTEQGLEVEALEPKGEELRGVLVAEVLGVKPHPNADKLRIVRVRAGSREEDVVCGASNVPPPGNRVCWAAPGAQLPGGRTLEGREIRGVFSPGMLCSEPEMGLGENADGILILDPSAPSGAEVAEYVGARDCVLEVNVTPNRADALSHVGVARDLAAYFRTRLLSPALLGESEVDGAALMDVQIDDAVACPRYTASFVTGLRVCPSPIAMRLRLQYCGVRAISNLVDVTNYVMLETGHPLHAFDLQKLAGKVTVRRALAGERMVTLDGQSRELRTDDIVITDGSGPVALAGVMGGASTEVSASTQDVLLEAATFDSSSIRRTARRLGLSSEASYRFERGVDANGAAQAAQRAASLLAVLGGGRVVKAIVDRFPRPPVPVTVELSAERLRRVTGSDYSIDFARRQLERLGISCVPTASGLMAIVPSYRQDISIAEDLIEEILRLGEYGKPADKERLHSNAKPESNPEAPADRTRGLLAAAGLHEIVSWAFVPRTVLDAVADGKDTALSAGIVVKNPISADYEVMRTCLLPGLADALKRNVSRGQSNVWLFEVGPIVRRAVAQAAPVERNRAAGMICGRRADWLKPGDPLDFFDLKRVVEDVLRGFGIRDAAYLPPGDVPYLHPGVSAEISTRDGKSLGHMGEVHPAVARRLGLDVRAFYFELSVDALASTDGALRTVAPPRFPAVTRDVSFWIAEDVSAEAQRAAMTASGETLLRGLSVLEDFRDPKFVPSGKKGMLWTLTYRAADRTLTDAEVDQAHARVVKALSDRCPIQIR